MLDEENHTFPSTDILKCAVMLRHPDQPSGGPRMVDYVINTSRLDAEAVDYIKRCIKHITRTSPMDGSAPDEIVYRFTDSEKLASFAVDVAMHTVEKMDDPRMPWDTEAKRFWNSRNYEMAFTPSTHAVAAYHATATIPARGKA